MYALTRLADLLEAWDLDPRHPIALFVSGSSERLPGPPPDAAELAEAQEAAEEAESEAEDLRKEVGNLEDEIEALEKELAAANEEAAKVRGLEAQVALLGEGDPTGRLAAEARAETDRVKAAHRTLLDQIARSAESVEEHLARKGARKEFALRSLRWIQSAAKGS